jgi:DoxX-like family
VLILKQRDNQVLRASLIFVWLTTAWVTVWEMQGQSLALLSTAGVQDPAFARSLILGGAAVDAVLGLMLWFKPIRITYLMALGMMLVFTVLATVLIPVLWLHPLGPLTKNFPIAAILWILAKEQA